MRFRKLRIAWSVVWSVVAVLFVLLWVRSYSWCERYCLPRIGTKMLGANSPIGNIVLTCTGDLYSGDGPYYWSAPAAPESMFHVYFPGPYYWPRLRPWEDGFWVILPMWLPIAMSIGLGFGPWLRYRFSLRTLLIATTLVAMVLGVIVVARH
jgi:hypothetical protein